MQYRELNATGTHLEHRKSDKSIAQPRRYSIPSFLIRYRNDRNVIPSSAAAFVLL